MNPYQYDPEAAVASLIAKLPATADEIVDLIRAGNEEDALEAVARSVDAKGDLLETRWRLVAEHDRFMDELLARPDLGSQQPLG